MAPPLVLIVVLTMGQQSEGLWSFTIPLHFPPQVVDTRSIFGRRLIVGATSTSPKENTATLVCSPANFNILSLAILFQPWQRLFQASHTVSPSIGGGYRSLATVSSSATTSPSSPLPLFLLSAIINFIGEVGSSVNDKIGANDNCLCRLLIWQRLFDEDH